MASTHTLKIGKTEEGVLIGQVFRHTKYNIRSEADQSKEEAVGAIYANRRKRYPDFFLLSVEVADISSEGATRAKK